MQFPGQGKAPLGVVYSTTMNRPDAALALAMLDGYEGKREARVAAVAVNGSELDAARFCDIVNRFYLGPGPIPNSNNRLPVGFAADDPQALDDPMAKGVLYLLNDKGEPLYPCGVTRVSDTAEVQALIRNALTNTADQNAVVVLSAPATCLAAVLDLPLVRELIIAKVKALVVSDSGARQDVAAARKLLAAWPAPVVFCPRELGEALRFPGSSIEKDFAWTPAHPVAHAYRVYRAMPYDAASWDMAAMLYAVHPDAGLFHASETGTIQLRQDGSFEFHRSAEGKHKSLSFEPAQKDKIVQAYIEIASAKPVPRPARFGPPVKKQP
jgi:hypothetical protein